MEVGCVIVKGESDEGVGMGWKGRGGGMGNVCEMEEEGEIVRKGCVIDGEENGVMGMGENGDDLRGLVMFVRDRGWGDWSEKMMEKGKMDKVYYEEGYGMMDGMKRLMKGGIEV